MGTTSAEETSISSDPLTPTRTVSSARSFPRLPPRFDLMALSTSILPSSRRTWCHTLESTSLLLHTHLSSPPRRPTTSSSQFPRSQTPASSPPTRWSSAILDMASTWPAVCSTEVTLSPRMSTPQSPTSRLSELSNSSTGVQQVSRSASTTSHQRLSPAAISPRSSVPFACSPTLPPSPRPGLDLTTSSISVRQASLCPLVRWRRYGGRRIL